MPYISNPSSVNVPVLSKHITVTLPLIFTLGGEIQNTLLRYNLVNAIDTPIWRQVGKAGGTVIVIKSNPSLMNSQ